MADPASTSPAAGPQPMEPRAFHRRQQQRHRGGGRLRHDPRAASAPIPAVRSAVRRRCAASPGSSRPTGSSAAPASRRQPSASTISGRWRGPPRIARSCCRRSPATTRATPPAPTAPIPDYRRRSAAASRECGSASSTISMRPTTRSATARSAASTRRSPRSAVSAPRSARCRCRRCRIGTPAAR